jgi:hypothetical protein
MVERRRPSSSKYRAEIRCQGPGLKAMSPRVGLVDSGRSLTETAKSSHARLGDHEPEGHRDAFESGQSYLS